MAYVVMFVEVFRWVVSWNAWQLSQPLTERGRVRPARDFSDCVLLDVDV